MRDDSREKLTRSWWVEKGGAEGDRSTAVTKLNRDREKFLFLH